MVLIYTKMKKILYLFSVLVFALSSCSGDEENSANPVLPENNYILPKKIVVTEGAEKFESVYVYNGNKIVSITYNTGEKSVYTYTGDFITKTENFKADGKINSQVEYTYDGGKLVSELSAQIGGDRLGKYRTVYFHSSSTSVTCTEYVSFPDVNGGAETREGELERVMTFSGGNLVKRFSPGGMINGVHQVDEVNYEYDTKNSPFKNILGYNLLIGYTSLVNNITKLAVKNNPDSIIKEYVSNYAYEYNDKGYPTKRVETYSLNANIKFLTEYTY